MLKSVAFWSQNLWCLLCSTDCCNHSPDSYDMFSRRLKCVSNSVCIHTEQKIRDNGKGTRKKRYAIYCSDLVIYLFRCKLWTLNPCTDVQTRRKAGHLIQTTGTVKASLSASPGDLEGQKIATRNLCRAFLNQWQGYQESSAGWPSLLQVMSPSSKSFLFACACTPLACKGKGLGGLKSAKKVQTWSGYLH